MHARGFLVRIDYRLSKRMLYHQAKDLVDLPCFETKVRCLFQKKRVANRLQLMHSEEVVVQELAVNALQLS